MSATRLVQQGEGRYVVQGELSFDTVTGLLSESHSLFAGESSVELDLSGVTYADSAGLALLVEWLRQARLQGRQLRYQSLPAQLQSLANVSEVTGLLNHSA